MIRLKTVIHHDCNTFLQHVCRIPFCWPDTIVPLQLSQQIQTEPLLPDQSMYVCVVQASIYQNQSQ